MSFFERSTFERSSILIHFYQYSMQKTKMLTSQIKFFQKKLFRNYILSIATPPTYLLWGTSAVIDERDLQLT